MRTTCPLPFNTSADVRIHGRPPAGPFVAVDSDERGFSVTCAHIFTPEELRDEVIAPALAAGGAAVAAGAAVHLAALLRSHAHRPELADRPEMRAAVAAVLELIAAELGAPAGAGQVPDGVALVVVHATCRNCGRSMEGAAAVVVAGVARVTCPGCGAELAGSVPS